MRDAGAAATSPALPDDRDDDDVKGVPAADSAGHIDQTSRCFLESILAARVFRHIFARLCVRIHTLTHTRRTPRRGAFFPLSIAPHPSKLYYAYNIYIYMYTCVCARICVLWRAGGRIRACTRCTHCGEVYLHAHGRGVGKCVTPLRVRRAAAENTVGLVRGRGGGERAVERRCTRPAGKRKTKLVR